MFYTGLVAAPDQKTRVQVYQTLCASTLDHPAFVGCHWFQFMDEPLTGRSFDGENYNINFLIVTDLLEVTSGGGAGVGLRQE
jgi:hypothetical protein